MGKTKTEIRKLYALSSENKRFSFTQPLKHSIRIGQRDYDVKLKSDEKHGTYILWKNRKYPVEIVRSRQNRYEILFNDISYTFTVETPFSMKRMKVLNTGKEKSNKVELKAPMPGKIIDVLVREGASILRGEPLLILEAMKMQNEIIAMVSGKIRSIRVKQGDSVAKDDVLMEIER